MEEIVKKIDELIKVVENNGVPAWLTWVGILVPIIISIAVIVQASVQAGNNKKLQKHISDREVKVQMHSDFLNIYDAFCTAQNTIGKAQDNISVIFSNQNDAFQWTNELIAANNGVCQAMNRARLLLPNKDNEFLLVLQTVFYKYRDLRETVLYYINSGEATNCRNQTWAKISQTYGIVFEDYATLVKTPMAFQDFIKLNSNDTTNKINDLIKELIPLFEYEKFDKYFEKYVRIEISEDVMGK